MNTAKRLLARVFPRKVYYATIIVAGSTVKVAITAPDYRRALLEAEYMAEGGELLECTESA